MSWMAEQLTSILRIGFLVFSFISAGIQITFWNKLESFQIDYFVQLLLWFLWILLRVLWVTYSTYLS